jgi:hypothetical protein
MALVRRGQHLNPSPGLRRGGHSNGAPTQAPAHANSSCVFSGQNDDPMAPIISAEPIPAAPSGPGGRAQNYGQDVRYGLLDHTVVTPGQTCKGGSNPDNPPAQ